jgi:hypothetical protein
VSPRRSSIWSFSIHREMQTRHWWSIFSTTPALSQRREERKTLNTLRNRKDIVIKPANKGGAVVVWRKDLYITEVEEHQFLWKRNPQQNNKIVENTIISEINKRNLPEDAKFLVIDNPRTSTFYLLPKIHKVGNPYRAVAFCRIQRPLSARYRTLLSSKDTLFFCSPWMWKVFTP